MREANERWPLRIVEASDASTAARSAVELGAVVHDYPQPDMTTVRLRFDGVDTEVIVDSRQSRVRFRFVRGAHPWSLDPAHQRALLETLVSSLSPRRDDPGTL